MSQLPDMYTRMMNLPTNINEIGRVRLADVLKIVEEYETAIDNKYNQLAIRANENGMEITIHNKAVSLVYVDTKQAIINQLISSGLLEEGQIVRSRNK